jgi:uracil-DNA glycosylase family 4
MDTYVTCVAKCAPPDNKPSPEEIQNCSRFLLQEFDLLSQAQVFVALGKVAWDSLLRKHPDFSDLKPKPKFAHGAEIQGLNGATLLGSYHPSQQNTFTKRLTEPMLDEIFERARALAWDHRGVAFL